MTRFTCSTLRSLLAAGALFGATALLLGCDQHGGVGIPEAAAAPPAADPAASHPAVPACTGTPASCEAREAWVPEIPWGG
jgi:hypothetical protein